MPHRRTSLTLDRFGSPARSDALTLDRLTFDDHGAATSGWSVEVPIRNALASRPLGQITALATVLRSTLKSPGRMRQLHDLSDRRFPVEPIDFSESDIRLPFGVPRFVSGRTLKLMAGGSRADRLLRAVGKEWEFVDDDEEIDLDDASKRFRVGPVTIFS